MELKDKEQREGVRGGLEQFRWDSLKSQTHKDRGQYLGASTKLGVLGRFGQYTRNDWWRADKDEKSTSSSLAEEKSRVKQMEEELMREALGLKPKRLMLAKDQLSSDQVTGILKREDNSDLRNDAGKSSDRPAESSTAPEEADGEVVSGLGYRKYLKQTDWASDVCDLDDEEVLAPQGEKVMAVKPLAAVKRELIGPARMPPVKEEPVRSSDHSRRERRRSRSRSRDRHESRKHSRY